MVQVYEVIRKAKVITVLSQIVPKCIQRGIGVGPNSKGQHVNRLITAMSERAAHRI